MRIFKLATMLLPAAFVFTMLKTAVATLHTVNGALA